MCGSKAAYPKHRLTCSLEEARRWLTPSTGPHVARPKLHSENGIHTAWTSQAPLATDLAMSSVAHFYHNFDNLDDSILFCSTILARKYLRLVRFRFVNLIFRVVLD